MTGGGLRALADIPEIALTEGTRDTSPSHQRNPSDSNLSDLSDSTPEALLCAICLQVLYHPVLWPGGDGDKETCGHSFCRRCVRACLSLTASACCPLCRVPAAANAAECELVVDAAMSARLLREAPAQLAARSRARMRELEVFSSLNELFIYKLDRRYDFKPGYVINLRLREPRHLWLVVKLLESGVRKLGLLMGPESQGTNGMLATVMNLPFRPTSMTLTAALGRVSFERKSKVRVPLAPAWCMPPRWHRLAYFSSTAVRTGERLPQAEGRTRVLSCPPHRPPRPGGGGPAVAVYRLVFPGCGELGRERAAAERRQDRRRQARGGPLLRHQQDARREPPARRHHSFGGRLTAQPFDGLQRFDELSQQRAALWTVL